MNAQTIRQWLRESDAARLEELWQAADEARWLHVGDEVHLRALVEISNQCIRQCLYCGLRAPRTNLPRYRMSPDEIVACAEEARAMGYGTVVLQAGEDPAITKKWAEGVIGRIRAAVPQLAITLSLGERTEEELLAWKEAGADRYLLRFETSNRELFDRIHPSWRGRPALTSRGRLAREEGGERPAVLDRVGNKHGPETHPRVRILRALRRLGYEVGSGVMIGIPGQTYEDLARDIEFFAELDLDMIGVGPFIAHPDTPLGAPGSASADVASADVAQASRLCGASAYPRRTERTGETPVLQREEQVPATEEMTYKVVALARLVCPDANIPSTTALATVNRLDGREKGLLRGANVVMPNLTPMKYRRMYEIYPAKACLAETPQDCNGCLDRRIRAIGRRVGSGRGDSPRKALRSVAEMSGKER